MRYSEIWLQSHEKSPAWQSLGSASFASLRMMYFVAPTPSTLLGHHYTRPDLSAAASGEIVLSNVADVLGSSDRQFFYK